MTTLVKGQRYTAIRTGRKNGLRMDRVITFTASRDQEPEPFIRNRTSPDQDRIFVRGFAGSVPELVVAGSIRPAN